MWSCEINLAASTKRDTSVQFTFWIKEYSITSHTSNISLKEGNFFLRLFLFQFHVRYLLMNFLNELFQACVALWQTLNAFHLIFVEGWYHIVQAIQCNLLSIQNCFVQSGTHNLFFQTIMVLKNTYTIDKYSRDIKNL